MSAVKDILNFDAFEFDPLGPPTMLTPEVVKRVEGALGPTRSVLAKGYANLLATDKKTVVASGALMLIIDRGPDRKPKFFQLYDIKKYDVVFDMELFVGMEYKEVDALTHVFKVHPGDEEEVGFSFVNKDEAASFFSKVHSMIPRRLSADADNRQRSGSAVGSEDPYIARQSLGPLTKSAYSVNTIKMMEAMAGARRWLVCVDGSEESANAAFTAAVDLVQPSRSDEILFYSAYWDNSSQTRAETALADCKAFMGAHHRLEEGGLKIGYICDKVSSDSSKKIAANICKIAADRNIHYIVMGCRGLQGIKKSLLGSVSAAVQEEAPCPVMFFRVKKRV